MRAYALPEPETRCQDMRSLHRSEPSEARRTAQSSAVPGSLVFRADAGPESAM
ncbi:MAG: hypothetical protein R6U36_00910 [Candidatus Fermentibacteraceae bacterium]